MSQGIEDLAAVGLVRLLDWVRRESVRPLSIFGRAGLGNDSARSFLGDQFDATVSTPPIRIE